MSVNLPLELIQSSCLLFLFLFLFVFCGFYFYFFFFGMKLGTPCGIQTKNERSDLWTSIVEPAGTRVRHARHARRGQNLRSGLSSVSLSLWRAVWRSIARPTGPVYGTQQPFASYDRRGDLICLIIEHP